MEERNKCGERSEEGEVKKKGRRYCGIKMDERKLRGGRGEYKGEL